MSALFEAFACGAIRQPRPGRVRQVRFSEFVPGNLDLFVECVAEALTRPVEFRRPSWLWTALEGAVPGNLKEWAAYPLKVPPRAFDEIILVDIHSVDSELLNKWPAFRARLAVELRIRSRV